MKLLNLSFLSILIIGLSSCGGGGVDRTAPIPKGTSVKVGKPYHVSGKRYTPQYRSEYVQEGIASWYGPGFQGKKTASGERFNTHKLTAAHPTLQLPSLVKVTNLENGKTVVVRVNDRGPFAKNRIIDLSMAAAEALDFKHQGTARVRIELLNNDGSGQTKIASKPPTIQPTTAPIKTATVEPIINGYFIQMGAFRVESNAKTLAGKLGTNAGISASEEFYKVYIGPFPNVNQAVFEKNKLIGLGYKPGKISRNI